MYRRTPWSNPDEVVPHLNIKEILEAAYATVNAQMQQILLFTKAMEKDKDKVACFGCTSPDCCILLVETYLPEAIVLLHGLSQAKRDETIKQLVLQGRRQRAFVGSPSDDIVRYTERVNAWCNKKEQCVLLDDEGRCSVYDYAPSACRLYFVAAGSVCAKGQVQSANTGWFEEQFMSVLLSFNKTFDAPSVFAHKVAVPGVKKPLVIPGGYPIGAAVEMAADWLFPGVDLTDTDEDDDV